MNFSPAFSESLKAISEVMAAADDPWWIIASAAVALHGADAGHVADVDVLLSIADAQRILPAIGIEPMQGPAHPAFRSSIFAPWNRTALPVEFMADFHRRSGNAWLPVYPATRQRVEVEGAVVYIPERTELYLMLIAFGRPKDIDRARSLASLA